jgi:hypothetical protein
VCVCVCVCVWCVCVCVCVCGVCVCVCVSVCDLEASKRGGPGQILGCCDTKKNAFPLHESKVHCGKSYVSKARTATTVAAMLLLPFSS